MMTFLRMFLALPATAPFVESYLRDGDETALLVLCDLVEEGADVTYHELARTLRASIQTDQTTQEMSR